MYKIVILGNTGEGSLEKSYQRAFENLGHEILIINVDQAIGKYVPYGKIGKLTNNFIGIDSWTKKGNRDIVLTIKDFAPNLILLFCNVRVLFGSLAFLKSVTNAKIGLIWPDTLFNLSSNVVVNCTMFDFVATYSNTSVEVFEKAGFNNVFWLPLAADPWLHGIDTLPPNYKYDITFIGGWRPEREFLLNKIKLEFPNAKMLIKGPAWLKRCKIKSLREVINDGPVFGLDFSKLVNTSKINLNIIDDTNYPAANMRFFEIPICNGFQLSNLCPEFENLFKDGETIAYFSDEIELFLKIKKYLSLDQSKLQITIENAHTLVNEQHTYTNRVQTLLSEIDLN